MKKLVVSAVFVLTVLCGRAQNPQPLDVANTVSNFWFGNNLTNLSAYSANLCSGTATNYLPAIMVSIFYDRMFSGKLVDASNKLARVKAKVDSDESAFSTGFKYYLSVLMGMTSESISDGIATGVNPNAMLAEPQGVRDDMGTFMIPDIGVLYQTPGIILP